MSYKVEILRGALKQLKKIPSELQERIQIKIDDLATEPRPNGVKKLKEKENAYRIRVGDYRVIYDIFDDILVVNVVEVGHRKNIYKDES
ncbi:RelE/StbE family addiction module toxin [Nostoc linckia z18]|uniref:RelE/StbE family addiction module toxin n=2 Tax=Nostoc linckia TaxID=92942 RepID=A0A9Q5Z8P2_NOSLI|nr:type II toxin-antitoxin system RelE/ParE family toxin [Nostoc linckia]PHK39527.1 RelE/StbE family addiction module toxin [Nostoc linckia z15]PHK46353.1 RelE/StbE family addiction module toxin [Nostoc linckia z16]PHJ63571.1 RelE/StbE family addiction module toxin [Nostoc linckia z3]PHJ65506.1 RelE/StbE family addiction module toxin [Nostoc linckia z1]PHJ76989.1 RelE/StbE family addiction module toxin [Nostoc linckia z2]